MTAELAQDVLKDVFPQGEVAAVTIERIQEVVCDRFSMSLEELCSHKRSQNIVYPRQVAMYLSRELTDSSLPKIGKHFGDRDHTTVLHANSKITRHDSRRSHCVQPCAGADRAHQTGALNLWSVPVVLSGACWEPPLLPSLDPHAKRPVHQGYWPLPPCPHRLCTTKGFLKENE